MEFKSRHPVFWAHALDLYAIGSQIRGGDISVSFGRGNIICPTDTWERRPNEKQVQRCEGIEWDVFGEP